MNVSYYRNRFPDPGKDPVARLRHVIDVFAEEVSDDRLMVAATRGVHETDTGLTFGDLRALLAMADEWEAALEAARADGEAVARQVAEEML